MTIIVEQSNSDANNATSNWLELAFSGNITDGNRIIIAAFKYDSAGAFTQAHCEKVAGTATLDTITLDREASDNELNRRTAIWSAEVTGTGSCTIRVYHNNSSGGLVIGVFEISGAGGVPIIKAGNSADADTGAPSSGNASSTEAAIFIGCAQIQGGPVTITPDAAFTTLIEHESDDSVPTGSIIYRIVSGATTDSASFTSPTTVVWVVGLEVYQEEPFPATGILDNFNRNDENPLSGWTESPQDGPLQVISNTCRGVDTDRGNFEEFGDPVNYYGPDTEVHVTCVTFSHVAEEEIDLFARSNLFELAEDAYIAIYFQTIAPTNYQYWLAKFVNGQYFQLGDVVNGPQPPNGTKFGLSCVGSLITFWANYGSGWEIIVQRTDTDISHTGGIGFSIHKQDTICDDFGGGTIGATPEIEETAGLNRTNGLVVLEEVEGGAIQEQVTLSKSLSITKRQAGTIEEAITLSITLGIEEASQANVQDAVSLTRAAGQSSGDLTNVIGATSLAELKAIAVGSQTNERDAISLTKYEGLTAQELKRISETIELVRSGGISLAELVNVIGATSLTKLLGVSDETLVNVKDALNLSRLVGITAVEETQGNVQEAVTLLKNLSVFATTLINGIEAIGLDRYDGITVTEQVESAVIEESITLAAAYGVSTGTQAVVQSSATLTKFVGQGGSELGVLYDGTELEAYKSVLASTQALVGDSTTLARSVGITALGTIEGALEEYVTLTKILVMSSNTQAQTFSNTSLTRILGVNAQPQLRPDEMVTLAKAVGVNAAAMISLYETASIARLAGTTVGDQANVFEMASLLRALGVDIEEGQVFDEAALLEIWKSIIVGTEVGVVMLKAVRFALSTRTANAVLRTKSTEFTLVKGKIDIDLD
jgi:hypothetical protein